MAKIAADDRLPGELGAAAQPQAAPHEQLDEVVDEADQAKARHQEQHQHARGGHRVAGEQVPGDVADQRRDDDDDAAHGGRAALAQVRLRAVGPDLLAELALAQHGDRRPGAEQRDDHRDRAGQQDGLHRHPPRAGRPRLATGRLSAMLSLVRRPRGAAGCAARRPRPRASGTAIASPCQPASARAPSSTGRACSPTAIRPATPAWAASRPASAWLSAAMSPSSAMWPSTANPRRPAACRHMRQRLDRGAHRIGVGVVGVVDDEHPVGALAHFHPPPAARGRRRQRVGDRRDVHAEFGGDRGGGEGVRHVVRAVQPQRDRRRAAGHHQPERGTAEVVEPDRRRASDGGVADTAPALKITTRARVRSAIASTRGSSAFRIADAAGGAAPRRARPWPWRSRPASRTRPRARGPR